MGLFGSKKPTPAPTPPAKKGRKATPATPAGGRGRKATTAAPAPRPRKAATPPAAERRITVPPKPARYTPALEVPAELHRHVAAQICAAFASDNVQPHEVAVKADGSVWIDRRRKDSRAVPIEVGRWK